MCALFVVCLRHHVLAHAQQTDALELPTKTLACLTAVTAAYLVIACAMHSGKAGSSKANCDMCVHHARPFAHIFTGLSTVLEPCGRLLMAPVADV